MPSGEDGPRPNPERRTMLKNALLKIPGRIEGLLADYAEDLEQAWTMCGEEPLTISFSAKIGIAKGKNVCEVGISFTKDKIKDSQTFEWSNVQGDLFKPPEKMEKDFPGHDDLPEDKAPFYNGKKKKSHETAS